MEGSVTLQTSRYQTGKLFPVQHGVGLVELLVAMAIGLLLTAGIIQIFSGSRQTYRVQEDLSHIQENGRFALIQLGNIVRMAGFKTDPTDTLTFATGAITGTETTGGPDQVSVFFQGESDGTTFDCLGNPVAASATVVNTFSINSNSLRCASSSGTQDLVENVQDMQITYGVDANGTGSANYYVNASSVTDWSQVVSLHVSLLLRSQEDNLAPVAQTYQYNGATTTAADRRLRAVFNTTIALRNRLP